MCSMKVKNLHIYVTASPLTALGSRWWSVLFSDNLNGGPGRRQQGLLKIMASLMNVGPAMELGHNAATHYTPRLCILATWQC